MNVRDHTRTITEAAETAGEALRYFEGRVLNGWSELDDPSAAYFQLRGAKQCIETAMKALVAANKAGWSKNRKDGYDD
jgi:hypothetical protein